MEVTEEVNGRIYPGAEESCTQQPTGFRQECKRFLSHRYATKEDFIGGYKELCSSKNKAETLYHQILTELKSAVCKGNFDRFKELCCFIDYLTDAEDNAILQEYNDNAANPLKGTNLVILACQFDRPDILDCVLASKILLNLSLGLNESTVLPGYEDESGHNVFYYAIRSGNVQLVETLIAKWPGNYFAVNVEALDDVLSRAYEELKLKNVPLTEEIEMLVESKLLNLRFFSNTSRQNLNTKTSVSNVKERVELVLENIDLLNTEYAVKKVDERFLFVAKFIAQNIHILKRKLKSTYDTLPWEEIEFCLVSFISSYIKQQEINLFYNATLSKKIILGHLENFGKILKDISSDIEGKFSDLPKLKREKVVDQILSQFPQFEGLYKNYQQIRDVYSLWKISDYVKLALLTNPKKKEGQLIITRVLQVLGEYLKNTLESPNLSNSTNELLLLSLPKNTREIIIDLRNSLSHAYSLSKRTEIEDNTDVNFFIGVQNDVKIIENVVTDILCKNKMKMIKILLKKVTECENIDDLKELADIIRDVKLDEKEMKTFQVMEHEKLEKLIKELGNNLPDKTGYEKEMFNKMKKIISLEKSKSANAKFNYVMAFASFTAICLNLKNNTMDQNEIKETKYHATKVLESMPSQIDSHYLKEIAELSRRILHLASLKPEMENISKLNSVTCQIFFIAEFGTGDLKWIGKLRDKLNEKGSFVPFYKQKKTSNFTKEKYSNQLELKLSELKQILVKNDLTGKENEILPAYVNDKNLQAIVEMLVLDIMSILGTTEKHLENNLLFLDDSSPLLTGKCLRNHLAHDNTLVDVLLSDPSTAVILNAKKIINENVVTNKKRIGKTVKDDPEKLKLKFNRSLQTITNQDKMFAALTEGNFKDLKASLTQGADLFGKTIQMATALHFAARGPNLEVVKFIIDKKLDVNAKDVNGQTCLHIASAYGRNKIVKFLIEEADMDLNDADGSLKVPLHFAAENGYKDTVEVLLKCKADFDVKDTVGFTPLHYAIRNNHIEAVMVLLEKETDVDSNIAPAGFTPLHIAAERGYLKIVKMLLNKGARVNVKHDQGGIPLHVSSMSGNPDVVNALIAKGADVKASVLDGCTSLHYAVEYGHESMVKILLIHGAKVNAACKTYWNTPLHYAAKDGFDKIVVILLKNKANASIATVEGLTPLHFGAKSGNPKVIAALFEHNVDVNVNDKSNSTPLHYAVENGHKDVAQMLISKGANVDAKRSNKLTPLYLAAIKGHKDLVELLLNNSADVTAKDFWGMTPLHAAAMIGNTDIIKLLIKNNANVNDKNTKGVTALQIASVNGHEETVKFLIKAKAELNTEDVEGLSPLHSAIIGGHKKIVQILIANKAGADNTPLRAAIESGSKEIVEILIANGAKVNAESESQLPLISAIRTNNKEMVELLIKNGACANFGNGELLKGAIVCGSKDILEILLNNNAIVNVKGPQGGTPLHIAAYKGDKEVVKALIAKGAIVDAKMVDGTTPLFIAAGAGMEGVVEVLSQNKANANLMNVECGPLHRAAGEGHIDVVKILLKSGANGNLKDNEGRTPFELAVSRGHLEIVKILLKHQNINMNVKGNLGYTILHIAAQSSTLEMVKFLVENGCNINAKNAKNSKPIHIAAREGHLDIVKFFLSKGQSVNEFGSGEQTLLHYAALENRVEVARYLISQGADVCAKDNTGLTPTHIAAMIGNSDYVKVLLENGAIYNVVNNFNSTPLTMSKSRVVIQLLNDTEQLFEAVKRNCVSDVNKYIRTGGVVNARNTAGASPLHYAAWKGYDEIVKNLLQNKANPNAIGDKKFTPLHYAAKFSHVKIVKLLLAYGSVYNAVSDNGKTPARLSADKDITALLKLIDESFKNVEKDNAKVVKDLENVNDIDILKAVINAHDKQNRSLIVAAIKSKFSKIEELKQVLQSEVADQMNMGVDLFSQSNFQGALKIFRAALHKAKDLFGPNNLATLDIQTYIAKVLLQQGDYNEALKMFKSIFEKQKEMLGLDDTDTLSTRAMIALVLHYVAKDEEALSIFREVSQKQEEILGANHPDTLNTKFHMALTLDRLEFYDEALSINKLVFEIQKKTLGVNNPLTISAQNNVALVLSHLKKYEESLKIYREVYGKKKKILGVNHADSLRTLFNIAGVFFNQKKYNESLKTFQEVLNVQKTVLFLNHPEILMTLYNMGNVLFAQSKWISALKVFTECFEPRKAIFGPNDPTVVDISKKLEIINTNLKQLGSNAADVLFHLQKDIYTAASSGDIRTIRNVLKAGVDVNDRDAEGRTLLHFAVSNEHIDIVNLLIKHGANVFEVTNKGNTPLHTATSKDNKELVDVLLEHVAPDKLKDFVNAKTISGGTAVLHVAAKNGSFDIVKSLLTHGANYEIKNKDGKTAIDLSNDEKVVNLLKLIIESFKSVKILELAYMDKLANLHPDEISAVTNARNNQGKTLLQVAIATNSKNKASLSKLLEMLKI